MCDAAQCPETIGNYVAKSIYMLRQRCIYRCRQKVYSRINTYILYSIFKFDRNENVTRRRFMKELRNYRKYVCEHEGTAKAVKETAKAALKLSKDVKL